MSYIGNEPTSVAFLTDTFSGNGSTVAFTMSVAPATTTSILVAVTGVVQDPSTYAVAGTTLTFSAAPPSGTGNISVRYMGIPASGVATTAYRTVTEFTATSGQTTFSVPSYTVGYINVYRNGVMLGSADYTASNGTSVVLASGATTGDLVTTESFYVSSVLNAIPATAGAVNSTYIAGGAALANIGAAGLTQTYVGTNVAGTGPAFSAYKSANQTLSHNTNTKVTFDTESYDTNNNFTSSTFTPTVAGYYQVKAGIDFQGTFNRSYLINVMLYKNGANVKSSFISFTMGNGGEITVVNEPPPIYMNGSTDTLELYAYSYDYSASGSVTINGLALYTYFGAYLVRAA